MQILIVRKGPDDMDDSSKPRHRWFEKLSTFLLREPGDRQQLVDQLHAAFERNLLDAEALGMIEGVLSVSELTVRDVMVPRSQMDVIRIENPIEQLLSMVITTGHSRFPVVGEDRDDVLGTLLAKDLLHYFHNPTSFSLSTLLRPAIFVPESKTLNVLLKEFRSHHNHLAVVVDEYGGVAGLVTIEDVIEQIVGNIEDEYDEEHSENDIIPVKGQRYRVNALTALDDFNAYFETAFIESDIDTIGGRVVSLFGYVPKPGETHESGGLRFTILKADSRRLHSLLVEKLSPSPPSH